MNKISVETVINTFVSLGCEVTELKSWYQVNRPGDRSKAIYVAKSKRQFTRADISGYVPELHPAISPLSKEEARAVRLGAVRGQILPKEHRDEVDLIGALEAAARGLLSEEPGFKGSPRAGIRPKRKSQPEGNPTVDVVAG